MRELFTDVISIFARARDSATCNQCEIRLALPPFHLGTRALLALPGRADFQPLCSSRNAIDEEVQSALKNEVTQDGGLL